MGRGFEIAKGFENKEINFPVRKTKYSAGYDIEAAEDVIIHNELDKIHSKVDAIESGVLSVQGK